MGILNGLHSLTEQMSGNKVKLAADAPSHTTDSDMIAQHIETVSNLDVARLISDVPSGTEQFKRCLRDTLLERLSTSSRGLAESLIDVNNINVLDILDRDQLSVAYVINTPCGKYDVLIKALTSCDGAIKLLHHAIERFLNDIDNTKTYKTEVQSYAGALQLSVQADDNTSTALNMGIVTTTDYSTFEVSTPVDKQTGFINYKQDVCRITLQTLYPLTLDTLTIEIQCRGEKYYKPAAK